MSDTEGYSDEDLDLIEQHLQYDGGLSSALAAVDYALDLLAEVRRLRRLLEAYEEREKDRGGKR